VGRNGEVILEKTYCPIYKTAEIYDLARLFAIKDTTWGAYNFEFNVPKLYTDADSDVNNAANYSTSGNTTITSDKKVGLFIGSTGVVLANEIIIPSKDANNSEPTVIKDIDSNYTYMQSNCVYNIGYQPHSHAIAKGCLYLNDSRHKPAARATARKLTAINRKDGNMISDISEVEKNIVAADFTWDATTVKHSEEGCYQGDINKKAIVNYFLQEQGAAENVHLTEVYNNFNGTMARELAVFNANGTINKDMHWYGRTSGPIWDPTPVKSSGSQSKKYTEGNDAGYFRPQSVKMLPLIKL
jgi:hypothetical protein